MTLNSVTIMICKFIACLIKSVNKRVLGSDPVALVRGALVHGALVRGADPDHSFTTVLPHHKTYF